MNYGMLADIYDIDMGQNIGKSDIGLYLNYAREHAPVLELGCGTGRVLEPLAEHGLESVGLDKSFEMVRQARAKMNGPAASNCTLICADICRFSLKRSFGLAICAFSTYSKLLEDADQASFLKTVFTHLRPGGAFLLDMFVQQPDFRNTRDGEAVQDYENRWHAQKRCWISRRKRVWKDVEPCVNRIELEYAFIDTQQRRTVLRFEDYTRYTSREELESRLVEAGFSIQNVFSNYDKTPYFPGSRRMVFDARRPN